MQLSRHKKYAKCESCTCTKEYLLQIVRLFLTQMYIQHCTMHLKIKLWNDQFNL